LSGNNIDETTLRSRQTLIIGIGNPYRKDDDVGLYVARKVRETGLENIDVVEGVGDGIALLNVWEGASRVIVIDSVISGREPGSVYCFDAINEEIPTDLFTGYSTHSISVVDALELAKVLGKLPQRMILYGIEGNEFSLGVGLSPQVQKTADKLVERIIEECRL